MAVGSLADRRSVTLGLLSGYFGFSLGSLAGHFVLMHWRVTFIRQGFGDSIGKDSVPSGLIVLGTSLRVSGLFRQQNRGV